MRRWRKTNLQKLTNLRNWHQKDMHLNRLDYNLKIWFNHPKLNSQHTVPTSLILNPQVHYMLQLKEHIPLSPSPSLNSPIVQYFECQQEVPIQNQRVSYKIKHQTKSKSIISHMQHQFTNSIRQKNFSIYFMKKESAIYDHGSSMFVIQPYKTLPKPQ